MPKCCDNLQASEKKDPGYSNNKTDFYMTLFNMAGNHQPSTADKFTGPRLNFAMK